MFLLSLLVTLHCIATVSAFVAFIAIFWWAYSPDNRQRFEKDGQLALDDEAITALQSNKDIK